MSFALSTVFEIILVCAVLWGVWNEEKFVKFEDKLAEIIAAAIIRRRKAKAHKARLEADRRRAEIRRSRMHIVSEPDGRTSPRSGRVA